MNATATEVSAKFGVPRRRFLQAAAAAVTGLSAGPATAGTTPVAAAGARGADRGAKASVVLVGTAGGPILTSSPRKGICTAVTVGDRVYVIDLGHGAHTNFYAAGLAGKGDSQAFAWLRGIFFTHMHTDHVVEWPAVYATGTVNSSGALPASPIPVYGPADHSELPRVFPPTRPEPDVVTPQRPMPGITGITQYLAQAFAHDLNDRTRDNNMQPLSRIFDVRDIVLPAGWVTDASGIPPNLTAAEPLLIMEDEAVRVTATLVDHRPTAPVFAYRIDTDHGSVVISGDTAPCENLVALAQGVDVLVHEVIDPGYVQRLVASLPEHVREGVREHLLGAHTTVDQLGPLAERTGARHLALTHLVPATASPSIWRQAGRGFSGRLHVPDDLHTIPLGA